MVNEPKSMFNARPGELLGPNGIHLIFYCAQLRWWMQASMLPPQNCRHHLANTVRFGKADFSIANSLIGLHDWACILMS